MARDARTMRGEGPFVFAQARNGVGVAIIVDAIEASRRRATSA
jgi:Ni2+-binding GTPase involved in maturation of urease and hydrogenase